MARDGEWISDKSALDHEYVRGIVTKFMLFGFCPYIDVY